MTDPRIETQLIHAGEPRPRSGGAANVPIFQSTVYEFAGGDGDYHAIPYPRLTSSKPPFPPFLSHDNLLLFFPFDDLYHCFFIAFPYDIA